MSKILRRSGGVASIAIGLGVIFASTIIVDIPGPIEASKPEFVFKFNAPFVGLAAALAILGIVLVARSRKGTDESCAS